MLWQKVQTNNLDPSSKHNQILIDLIAWKYFFLLMSVDLIDIEF